MVLSNTPLMHMAAQKPTSEKELQGIYGLGETKIQQYGTIFIGEIRDYIDGANKEKTSKRGYYAIRNCKK